jgi:CheY-like chemotaxis protein
MKKVPSILLVDDDETTNYINKLIISRADFTDELLIASNGRDAIKLVEDRYKEYKENGCSRVPNLILLDINMPIMDGFGFLDNMQTVACFQDESIVVAVLTTSLNPRDIERVKQAGVNEFLSKPLTKESLESLVNKYF